MGNMYPNLGAVLSSTCPVLLIDSNGNAINTFSGSSGGVTAVNSITGGITIAGAGSVTVSNNESTITISDTTSIINTPATSSNNAVVLWSGSGANSILNSSVTIDSLGNILTSGSLGSISAPISGVSANSFIPASKTISSNYIATSNDSIIFANQSSTIGIGLSKQASGKQYNIISTVISSVNNIVVSGIAGVTIDGGASKTISSSSIGGASQLFSDGSNFWTITSVI